jgi:hypothetical protein
MAGKRELLEPRGDKRFVRRDARGRIVESDDVGRSLSQDRRRRARTTSGKGQGDKGDSRTAKGKRTAARTATKSANKSATKAATKSGAKSASRAKTTGRKTTRKKTGGAKAGSKTKSSFARAHRLSIVA